MSVKQKENSGLGFNSKMYQGLWVENESQGVTLINQNYRCQI